MRKFLYGCILLLLLFDGLFTAAQDFSNKGKDFWVGYGYHVRMSRANGGTQEMVLYFATESVTTVTVSIPGLGYSVTYPNIQANTIFTSNPLPKAGTQDSRLTEEGISDKGIHISSDKPIVAYAHIYDGNVSGATLLFPTNTLGREYYSVNSTQISNEGASNSWLYAVAVDTGTTVVQITPSANTLTKPAGQPYNVTLKQGQVMNVMGALTSTADPFTGSDLTGTTIKSISSGTGGCKRIAVFSGSGKISLTCNGSSSSADNYIVQAFPNTAWGKRYLTTPTRNFTNNFYRVCVTDPTTVVRLNGQVITGLINNFYYEFNNSLPALIEADKPVLVAQYITSQGVCGNSPTNGDPEVIYLSPVEQNIDRVILNSTPNSAIGQHFINVVLKSTAAGSFRLDGNPVTGFTAHPQDGSYSFVQLPVNAGAHRLQADSGFNAIAYGYGEFESYGYNAGTNVKDLYQFVSVQNQYATVNFPAVCKASPFYFYMTFPYQPAQLKWIFGPTLNAFGMADVTVNAPQLDSTWAVNDKQLYRYKLPTAYMLPATGIFPIRVIAQNPTVEGCSGEQEIDYDLEVIERPSAGFSFSATGCVSDSVRFTNESNLNGRPAIKRFWDFGDNTTSSVNHPVHLYQEDGSFPVKFSLVNDIGCISDTAVKTVEMAAMPGASFGVSASGCLGDAMNFTDSSEAGSSVIAKWTWNFGDNTPDIVATSAVPQAHTYATTGMYTVTLQVENNKGCKSSLVSKSMTVHPKPKIGFIIPGNCINDPISTFIDTSSIADGSEAQFRWLWNFGDGNATAGANTSTAQNGQHKYTATGDYNVSLSVTSKDGCISSLTQKFILNGAVPVPQFSFQGGMQQCSNDSVAITDNSSVAPGELVKLEIYWDYNNNPANKLVVERPVKGASYKNLYPEFFAPASKTYRVKLVVYSGINCLTEKDTTLTLLATPEVQFAPLSAVCLEVAPFNLQGGASNGAGTGVFAGKGVSSAGVFNPAAAGAGTHVIRYSFTGINGCINSKEQPLTVFPAPTVSAGSDKTVLEGGTATLNGEASGNNLTYTWTPATGLNNASVLQPVVTPSEDRTYTLMVRSANGCSASDAVLVKVLKSLEIPNAFSPNGDGVHDLWEVRYLDSYPGTTVEVFNRYGQKVFESRGYTKPWDGTLNGKVLPVGTYYYIIDPKNGRKPSTGFVDLIR